MTAGQRTAVADGPLTGRDAFLSDTAICAPGVVFLVGPAGVGKTRLAAELVARNEAPQRIWVDCRGFTDTTWFQALLEACDLPTVESDERTALRLITAYLNKSKAPIVVLDNFEHLAASVEGLVNLSSKTPKACYLVTTRVEPLGPDVRVVRVAPLPEGGVTLIRQLAEKREVAITDEDVGTIARVTGGIPLAIELAVRLIALLGTEHGLKTLEHGGISNDPLPLLIERSSKLLGTAERRLLIQAALSPRSFDPDDISKMEGGDVRSPLASLAAASLAYRTHDTRSKALFSLYPMVAAGVRNLYPDQIRPAFERRLVWLAGECTLRPSETRPEWGDRLRNRIEEVVFVIEELLDQALDSDADCILKCIEADYEMARRGTLVSPTLYRFELVATRFPRLQHWLQVMQVNLLMRAGRFQQATSLAEHLLASRVQLTPEVLKPLLIFAAQAIGASGRMELSEKYVAEALSLGNLDPLTLWRSLMIRGTLARFDDNFEAATRFTEEARELATTLGAWEVNASEAELARAFCGLGQLDRAYQLISSRFTLEGAGETSSLHQTHVWLSIAIAIGKHDEALPPARVMFEASEPEDFGTVYVSTALSVMAAELMSDNLGAVAKLFDILASRPDELEQPQMFPLALCVMSIVASCLERKELAARYADRANALLIVRHDSRQKLGTHLVMLLTSKEADDDSLDRTLESQLLKRLFEKKGELQSTEKLEIGPDVRWFCRDNGVRIELNAKPVLRRLLDALVNTQQSQPGKALDYQQIFQLVWEGDRSSPKSAEQRVRSAMFNLRQMGLSELIENTSDGYRLIPRLRIIKN